ncbi:MAG: TIGR03032 family protein [Magnetovibrionaceae bacterium]
MAKASTTATAKARKSPTKKPRKRSAKAEPAPAPSGEFQIYASPHFAGWLHEQNVSLGFTTYQAGKLFLIGLKETGQISVEERSVDRCMGIAAHDNALYVSSDYQIWRFENALLPGQTVDGYDRVYLPKTSHVTGAIDVHEMDLDGEGYLVFVNTKFSCISTLNDRYSFEPIWWPPFISKLAPEDRCHMNGMALVDGQPSYVTAVAATDTPEGWRERRTDGGVVIDAFENETVLGGLSMPHSPRWHRNGLWLLESGTGWFGRADLDAGEFEEITFCPGYARGMAMYRNYAVVCVSQPRDEATFGGLPLDDNLERAKLKAACGILVIDIERGEIVHWLRLDGPIQELFDIALMPGATRPRAVGFKGDEIKYAVSLPPTVDGG